MMKAYPEYRKIEGTWFNRIPSEWKNLKLKHVADIETGTTPSTTVDEYYEDNGTLWVKPDDLDGINPIKDSKKKLSALGVKESRPLPSDSVLVCGIGTIGKFGVIKQSGCFNQQINGVSFDERKMIPKFGLFLIASLQQEFIRNSEKVVVSILNKTRQANISIVCPPLEEQKAIAHFLGRELKQLDLLISEKKSFIKLLQEKRQALISHVVTKGLDDSVKMKPSGVEWIGDIPEHWETSTLRRHTEEHKQGYYTTNDYVDDGLKLLRITDLRKFGGVDFSNCPKVPVESGQDTYILENGDFVFARTGGAGSFGLIQNLDEKVIFASYLIRFRFKKSLAPTFIAFALQSKPLFVEITKNMHGGVNQNIHAENIKDAILAYPSLEEQNAIADYLSLEVPKFEILEKEVNESITLLKEHRTALISAAVTGKIDVREEV